MHFREGTKACLFSVLPLTAPLVCLLRYQEKDNDNVPKLWYGTYHNHTIPTTALENNYYYVFPQFFQPGARANDRQTDAP